jgi:hypothetical protein
MPEMKPHEIARCLAAVCLLASLAVSACGDADMDDMARPNQIRAAAERCGLEGFEGNRAGAYWDANVPHSVHNWVVVEDCIYGDLEKSGLRATRFMNTYEWDAARAASGCRRDPASGFCAG